MQEFLQISEFNFGSREEIERKKISFQSFQYSFDSRIHLFYGCLIGSNEYQRMFNWNSLSLIGRKIPIHLKTIAIHLTSLKLTGKLVW
mmetsp:Transcript_18592/g.42504  ORF Transcript_18592/g.42504 Transcript_18592/m.42504 type:complete len:88 (-) Transcript_18592:1250-1513(-)